MLDPIITGYLADVDSLELPIRQSGRVRSVADIAGTVIKYHDGAPVTIGQVADVRLGPAPKRGTGADGGLPAVVMTIQKAPGTNTLVITEQIDALEIMGINSAGYLIFPKVAAAVIIFPFLIAISMFLGIAGGYVMGVTSGACSTYEYVYGIQAFFSGCFYDGSFSHIPFGVIADILCFIFRVSQRNLSCKVSKPQRPEHKKNQVYHFLKLLFHLVASTKYVSVVLCKTPYPRKTMQFSALFISVHCAELRHSQWKLFIGPRTSLKYFTMVRTIHRFQQKLFIFMRCFDRLKRICSVFFVMPRTNIQFLVTNMWRRNRLITRSRLSRF